MARNDAMVMTWTSLWATCESSCAMTPSSSSLSSLFIRPVVTQRTALSALRPVANAFGSWVLAMAIRGLGMSASAHTRSTMPCRLLATGPSVGLTSTAPAVLSAILSE
jgi:hypothetical protein